jgi:hypothetical protein
MKVLKSSMRRKKGREPLNCLKFGGKLILMLGIILAKRAQKRLSLTTHLVRKKMNGSKKA